MLDDNNDMPYDTIMSQRRVIIDTNILYSGLYSSAGASFQLLRLVRSGQVIPCISATLAMEYEAVLSAHLKELYLTKSQLNGFLGYFIALSEWVKIFYLWRPGLRDPGDDMVLETAVSAQAEFIITHNLKDFAGAERFGVRVVTPGWFIHNFGGTLQ
ncbi:MAG: putative toxin-antitoxin system toxin component, PIN family [Sulfuricurvum sp.]|nr:putative toxin-antitoxin system toxin component, PIN family [Sulfuricurvum sp.]